MSVVAASEQTALPQRHLTPDIELPDSDTRLLPVTAPVTGPLLNHGYLGLPAADKTALLGSSGPGSIVMLRLLSQQDDCFVAALELGEQCRQLSEGSAALSSHQAGAAQAGAEGAGLSAAGGSAPVAYRLTGLDLFVREAALRLGDVLSLRPGMEDGALEVAVLRAGGQVRWLVMHLLWLQSQLAPWWNGRGLAVLTSCGSEVSRVAGCGC